MGFQVSPGVQVNEVDLTNVVPVSCNYLLVMILGFKKVLFLLLLIYQVKKN